MRLHCREVVLLPFGKCYVALLCNSCGSEAAGVAYMSATCAAQRLLRDNIVATGLHKQTAMRSMILSGVDPLPKQSNDVS